MFHCFNIVYNHKNSDVIYPLRDFMSICITITLNVLPRGKDIDRIQIFNDNLAMHFDLIL